jgi:hypothetical protein
MQALMRIITCTSSFTADGLLPRDVPLQLSSEAYIYFRDLHTNFLLGTQTAIAGDPIHCNHLGWLLSALAKAEPQLLQLAAVIHLYDYALNQPLSAVLPSSISLQSLKRAEYLYWWQLCCMVACQGGAAEARERIGRFAPACFKETVDAALAAPPAHKRPSGGARSSGGGARGSGGGAAACARGGGGMLQTLLLPTPRLFP